MWQSRFVVPAAAVSLFLDTLEEDGLSVAAFEEPADGAGVAPFWRIEMLHAGAPDERGLARRLAALAERAGLERVDLTLAPVPETDWLERTRAQFPPQPIGRFWVHGSHVLEAAPTGMTPIRIDAGRAFGSGEHATTRGCLEVIDRLARRRRFRRVLDLGCGSGVLAIAAAKCWPAQVLAVDNDLQAVAVAEENVALNGVGAHVRVVASEGLASPWVRAFAPYDLILANILADPLIGMAPATARALSADGILVLSGLTLAQASRVAAAHRMHGLRRVWTGSDGPWATLVLAPARPSTRRFGLHALGLTLADGSTPGD